MRSDIKNLGKEENGVSVVLGAILMFLVVGAMWGTIQAYHVPNWNEDVEYEHLDIVYDDMVAFKSDVEDVAVSGEPKSSNFHMGVRYPDRMFLANPSTGVAGALTSDNVAITIEYTIDGLSDPTITTNYMSNRVIYEVQGTVNSPKLVYEHGVIIKDYGDESATTDEQSLIVGDEIYLPVLTGNLTSLSSMETGTIEIKPMSQSYGRTNIKSVTITIDTDYPEVWEQLFAGSSAEETSTASDDFESGGWAGGDGWLDAWQHTGAASITPWGFPYEGNYHLWLGSSSDYVKREIDLSEATSASLQFWAKITQFESGDSAQCLISSNGVDWTPVHTWVDGDDDNIYHFYDKDLSTYELSSTFWIAFDTNMKVDYPWDWDYLYVDNLEIEYTHAAEGIAQIDLGQGEIIIESTDIRQIILPTGNVTTDALYAGLATFSTESKPVTYTGVDLSQDYPCILDISIDEGDDVQTQSTITATVKNVTAPFDIHADFTGLTNDPEMHDVFPDYSSPDSISATSWDVPNENTVRWTNISHPLYDAFEPVIVSFWVINTENNMQFFTSRVFNRKNANEWY